jgi:hypothetical protein
MNDKPATIEQAVSQHFSASPEHRADRRAVAGFAPNEDMEQLASLKARYPDSWYDDRVITPESRIQLADYERRKAAAEAAADRIKRRTR